MSAFSDYEAFTADEKAILSRFFTDVEGPVFALKNLPEVVKGALFARYSRSEKGLRRLFLDEFFYDPEAGVRTLQEYARGLEGTHHDEESRLGAERAEALYDRIFTEYGDDSVAQLGGAHLACENVSNIVTKVIERGRLMAYLEQSTRYIRYDKPRDGRFRYKVPPELEGTEARKVFVDVCDSLFKQYSALFELVYAEFEQRYPRKHEPEAAHRAAVRAKTCDALRGLLPAASLANVGIFGSGQAYERLLLRMLSSPLAEARQLGASMLKELRKVIPSFLRRVDMEDRGVAWRRFLSETRLRGRAAVSELTEDVAAPNDASESAREAAAGPYVELVDFDPAGEEKIAAAIIFEHSHLSLRDSRKAAAKLAPEELSRLISEYVGRRENRRHLPGRAFESTYYTFEVVSDYGAFRDLQRHRMLTIEWQQLGPSLGYSMPEIIGELDLTDRWRDSMTQAAAAYEQIREVSEIAASYVLPMAYRLRYRMQLNAREAMYLIELRTSKQAHPEYRSVCLKMADQIREIAGHRCVWEAMRFIGSETEDLERREAEARAYSRRQALG